MNNTEREQKLIKSIQIQTDAGFGENDIRKNLLTEGYSDEEIKPFLNPASNISSSDKRTIIKKSFVSYIILSIVGFFIFLILFYLFDVRNADSKTMKVIGGMAALSILGMAVGVYKFVSIYFFLYEVSGTKKALVWVLVIAAAILIVNKFDDLMTSLKI